MAIIGKIGDIELDDCVYRKQHKKCESCEYKENVEFGGELLLDVKDQVIEQKEKEIERLNNIIDEMEKWLDDNSRYKELFEVDRYYQEVLNKLKALKEGK